MTLEKMIYVEMEGMMEVRMKTDNVDINIQPPEDMISFQSRVDDIPDNFCQKDKQTTEQIIFFCNLCSCELTHPSSLKAHVQGNKHIKKAMLYKAKQS